jgi:PAS domain S-box-containing protein
LVEFWSNIHPSDFKTVRKAVDQGKEDGKPYIITYRLKLLDGSYKLIRSHSQPQYDEKGKYLGVVGQFEDLSENKAMGHILELSINIANSKYSEGLENISQSGSWEWDVISGEVTWTPALFPLYGCDAEKFTPSLESFTDLVHPEDIEFVMNTLGDALQTGSALDYVHRIIRPSDGEVRTFRCIGGILTDELGAATKVIGIAQDITELKSANLAFQDTLAEMKDDLDEWGSFEVNDESKTITVSEVARRMLRG